MRPRIQITPGQRFSKLTANAEAGVDARGKRLWECVCDYGNAVTVSASALRLGKLRHYR